jgi:hypothetical protein
LVCRHLHPPPPRGTHDLHAQAQRLLHPVLAFALTFALALAFALGVVASVQPQVRQEARENSSPTGPASSSFTPSRSKTLAAWILDVT